MTEKKAARRGGARPDIDWAAIELKYRTSGLSLRTIAADFGITEGAIRRRAKAESWARDLREKVRAATDSLLIRKTSTQDIRSERQAIAAEAEIQSDVVLRHRRGLARLCGIRDKLLDQIEAALDASPEFIGTIEALRYNEDGEKDRQVDALLKSIDRPALVEDVKKLVDIDEKVRRGEREAFGIGQESAGNSVDDLLLRIHQAQ